MIVLFDPNEHPSFCFAERIAQIVNQILNPYVRIYKNGDICWISNDKNFLIDWCVADIPFYSVVTEQHTQSFTLICN